MYVGKISKISLFEQVETNLQRKRCEVLASWANCMGRRVFLLLLLYQIIVSDKQLPVVCIVRQIYQHVKHWKENPNILILNDPLCHQSSLCSEWKGCFSDWQTVTWNAAANDSAWCLLTKAASTTVITGVTLPKNKSCPHLLFNNLLDQPSHGK